MSDHKKLGRGLGAIFGEDVTSLLEDIQNPDNEAARKQRIRIPVEQIRENPYQPRRHFDPEKLQELSDSIRQHGLISPILVRLGTHGYQLIAGERRLRATKLAGMNEIDALIVDLDDRQMMEAALIENVQREDLNVVEEAQGYKALIDELGLTQDALATKVSKSRSYITNLLRLLKLPQSVLDLLANGKLTMGQARPLITLDHQEQIEALAKRIVKEQLTARQVERLINPKQKQGTQKKTSDYSYPESLIEKRMQTRVKIDSHTIHIHFEDDEDLNRLLELLGVIEESA